MDPSEEVVAVIADFDVATMQSTAAQATQAFIGTKECILLIECYFDNSFRHATRVYPI
jgi:hypothetical protein